MIGARFERSAGGYAGTYRGYVLLLLRASPWSTSTVAKGASSRRDEDLALGVEHPTDATEVPPLRPRAI